MFDRLKAQFPRFWSLGVPLFIAACLLFLAAQAMVYINQRQSQSTVATQIPLKSSVVESFRARADAFQAETSQAEEELAASKARLPSTAAKDIAEEVHRVLFNLGDDAGVTVAITPGTVRETKTEGITYRTLQYVVAVQGDEAAVAEFLATLDVVQDELPTLVVESLSLDTGGSPTKASLEVSVHVLKV